MRTAVAIEDSRACASPAHRCIGSSRQWSFRGPHSAPSIVPFFVARNRLAILMLTHANPFFHDVADSLGFSASASAVIPVSRYSLNACPLGKQASDKASIGFLRRSRREVGEGEGTQ